MKRFFTLLFCAVCPSLMALEPTTILFVNFVKERISETRTEVVDVAYTNEELAFVRAAMDPENPMRAASIVRRYESIFGEGKRYDRFTSEEMRAEALPLVRERIMRLTFDCRPALSWSGNSGCLGCFGCELFGRVIDRGWFAFEGHFDSIFDRQPEYEVVSEDFDFGAPPSDLLAQGSAHGRCV
jgi:hypothetical protein